METREFILQKTLMLLGKKGYNGVSVSDIQQETGLARGLLYHYFGSQEQLFEEAIRSLMDKWGIEREKLKEYTLSDLIVYTIGRYQQLAENIQADYGNEVSLNQFYFLLMHTSLYSEPNAKMFKQMNNDRYNGWKTAVLNSFSRGELRSGLNLESIAKHFLYLETSALSSWEITRSNGELIYNLEKTLLEFYEIIKR